MKIDEKKLIEFLQDSDLVSKEKLEKVQKTAHEKDMQLGDVLVKQGEITGDDLRRVEAYMLGIPFISLKEEKLNFKTLSLIPEPIARSHNIVAFRKNEDNLEVAMLDTDDLGATDFIKKKTGLKILPRLTDEASIKSALLQYRKTLKEEFGDIIQKEAKEIKIEPSEDQKKEESESELKKLAGDLPIVRIVDSLLSQAILQNASDIHIEPREKKLLVRFRIDGILHDMTKLPKNAAPGVTARIKVLSNLKLDEKRLPQDGRFKIEREGEKVSFRVSIIPTFFGEKTVMRLLPENLEGFTLESAGFHGAGIEHIQKATKLKTGMILATGPTGSGKTTTLYTILEILNTPEVNISTVEDPIEFQLPRVNQTQVRPNIGFTFANGLRALVRQDPDILMVGEIRDNETAALAVNAALTGHLVLSTLHTNSSAGAIPRLIDMKVEPFLLASTLEVIISQRLVRKLCSVRKKRMLKKHEFKKLSEKADLDKVLAALREENIVEKGVGWEKIPFYEPKESRECEDGYSGRVGIHEVLPVSSAVREMITREATSKEIEEAARKQGMMTILENGIFKAAAGITTLEEVLRVVSE